MVTFVTRPKSRLLRRLSCRDHYIQCDRKMVSKESPKVYKKLPNVFKKLPQNGQPMHFH